MEIQNLQIESDRLLLVPTTEKYAQNIFENFDKETKEFIGNVGLHNIKTKTPELGIWIKKSAYGKKFGREAVGALISRANDNLEFDYMIYPVDKDNIPSRKIAESFGGIVEKDEQGNEIVEKNKTQDEEKILNSVVYRIYKKRFS